MFGGNVLQSFNLAWKKKIKEKKGNNCSGINWHRWLSKNLIINIENG